MSCFTLNPRTTSIQSLYIYKFSQIFLHFSVPAFSRPIFLCVTWRSASSCTGLYTTNPARRISFRYSRDSNACCVIGLLLLAMALNECLSFVVLLLVFPAVEAESSTSTRPLVIAHRGASGVLPEHTIEAYERAISDGADVIECDVTLSRDLVPVCLHDEMLSVTTDVADRPQLANRTRTLTVDVDGGPVRYLSSIFVGTFSILSQAFSIPLCLGE